MRWRFADTIDEFKSWVSIRGRKGVSLEEYSLMEPLGREGALPEALVLETCVHFARWLVARSSDFTESCLLTGVETFCFDSVASMGDNLEVSIKLNRRGGNLLTAECSMRAGNCVVAHGVILLELIEMKSICDPETNQIMWGEIAERS